MDASRLERISPFSWISFHATFLTYYYCHNYYYFNILTENHRRESYAKQKRTVLQRNLLRHDVGERLCKLQKKSETPKNCVTYQTEVSGNPPKIK